MKKITYLFVLMFSLVLMSTSCCKPEDETPLPNEITADKLVGNWNFVSLTDNSANSPYEVPLSQADITYLNDTYFNYGIIDIGIREKSYDLGKYEISIHYKAVSPAYTDFTVDGNILTIPFYSGNFNPEILKLQGNQLELKRGNATYKLQK